MTISKAAPSEQNPSGRNAFTCRTCPYQFVLDQPYYERTYMRQKQKDDILGEDQTDLPVNEGKMLAPSANARADLQKFLVAVRTRSAVRSGHTSTSCKPGARTNLQPLSTRYFRASCYSGRVAADVCSVRRMLQTVARILSLHAYYGFACVREQTCFILESR